MSTVYRRRRERQGTAAAMADEVLLEGEWGYTTDTHEARIGDGVTPFADLPSSGEGEKGDPGDPGPPGVVAATGIADYDPDTQTVHVPDPTVAPRIAGGTAYRPMSLDDWVTALAASAVTPADIVWIGDSLSELSTLDWPMPWQVLRHLSAGQETVGWVQAHNATSTRVAMTGAGTPTEAGLAGRSVLLATGQKRSCSAWPVRGVSVVYRQAPGAGDLIVRYDGNVVGTIDCDGPAAYSQVWTSDGITTSFLPATVEVEASGGDVLLEGVMVHALNRATGVRVWPAVRAGSTSSYWSTNPDRALALIDTVSPALVVIATGTNDTVGDGPATAAAVEALIDAVRGVHAGAIAVWVPYLNNSFVATEATAVRGIAETKGCAVIDASVGVRSATTTDGVHPTRQTIVEIGGHAATTLTVDPLSALARRAFYEAAFESWRSAASAYQEWVTGNGKAIVGDTLGHPVFGLTHGTDTNPQVLAMTAAFAALLGLPGATVSLGPGGGTTPDTHLSRTAAGTIAANNGDGTIAAGRVRLKNLGAVPAGPNQVGDLAVVAGTIRICTAAGSPGTWTVVGTQT